MDIDSWCSDLAYDQWVPLPVLGQRPSARYKHAAAVVDEKLYIIGGSRNGRYLSDVQAFDFKSLTWSSVTLKMEPQIGNWSPDNLLSTSGHTMITWGNKLLLIGGHSKHDSDSMPVRFIDLESLQCGFVETSGKAPEARGGHSASIVGSNLIVFGGEDRKRRLLNDVHILDLGTMSWELLEATQTPPTPRFDHIAAVHGDRYLIVFGGCSHSIFFSDLHVLDLQMKEWSQPEIRGDMVTPRAGHAGVPVGESWYVVGGGDNKSGCAETLMLNMPKLVWSTLTTVKERDPLASEGLSVCSALIASEIHLVAFGGYNGKYQNESTYTPWKKNVFKNLRGQWLFHHLTQLTPSEDDPIYDEWYTIDCRIYSQSLNAMDISVQTIVSNTDTVKELWDALVDLYSSLNDFSRLYDIVCGLLKPASAGRPLNGYYKEFKLFADEFDWLVSFTSNRATFQEQRNQFLVTCYLNRAGAQFDTARSQIILDARVPSLGEVHCRVFRTKSRKEVRSGSSEVGEQAAALYMNRGGGRGNGGRDRMGGRGSIVGRDRETRTCNYCGIGGHLRSYCRKLQAVQAAFGSRTTPAHVAYEIVSMDKKVITMSPEKYA